MSYRFLLCSLFAVITKGLTCCNLRKALSLNQSASIDPTAYPKVASWTLEGNNSDCCSWDGVECDEVTGHVIGLDLNSSCLYGSINSNSSLFHLYNKGLTGYLPDFQWSTPLEEMLLTDTSFSGDISESIGNLIGIRLLNLSNNILTGCIPPCLGKLAKLESLDLSQNKLLGEIPQQLTQLTFLESFNVSHNNLVGPIPHGKQFDTFQSSSFEGNSGLCGNPLTKKCENTDALLSPPPSSSQDLCSPLQFGWKIVVIGYGFGLVVGGTIGHIVTARNHDWLMKTFRMRQLVRRKAG
uniref:Leucine-rich repeat-containing N-terminal plant-type domain-containing protein n=1 Tax=Fagus sylvatica TaxID=28930 RepID=A0A2N9FQV4_FAGSY